MEKLPHLQRRSPAHYGSSKSITSHTFRCGRYRYVTQLSTMVCTPASLAQQGRMALGAQAGFARLDELIGTAGFTRVRKATETPFNIVLEART